jgi:hypothetical protein
VQVSKPPARRGLRKQIRELEERNAGLETDLRNKDRRLADTETKLLDAEQLATDVAGECKDLLQEHANVRAYGGEQMAQLKYMVERAERHEITIPQRMRKNGNRDGAREMRLTLAATLLIALPAAPTPSTSAGHSAAASEGLHQCARSQPGNLPVRAWLSNGTFITNGALTAVDLVAINPLIYFGLQGTLSMCPPTAKLARIHISAIPGHRCS